MSLASPRRVDVAIVGAGTAGLAAYRAARKAKEGTAKVLLIEKGPFGTTCARVGCMPSKLLIAAADEAHHAREAAPFGISCQVTVDGRAVMERVHRERDRFVALVVRDIEAIPARDKMVGHARLVGPGVLDVAGEIVEARAVVVAIGAKPEIPAMFDAVKDRTSVNDDVFAWDDLPASAAVFGAGPLGLELGQALHRLGVRVRIFGKGGNVGALGDPAVRAAAIRAFADEVPFEADAHVEAVRADGEGVAVHFRGDDGIARVESFARVVVAAGRRPDFVGLGLPAAGVPIDPEGSPMADRTTMQCARSAVFVAGDSADDTPVLNEAVDEGSIAGRNAAHFPDVTPERRRSRLVLTFSEPQLAAVGSTFAELAGRDDVVVGEVSFVDQGRSRILCQNRGLGHLYAERGSGRFLGAELAAPRAEHLGHLLAWAHQQGMSVDQMLSMPFYHPVIEEGLRTALRDLRKKLGDVSMEMPAGFDRMC
jgi:dihydrolipoamide dehydrogenase